MRVICLQFAPKLREREANLARATEILESSRDIQELPAHHPNAARTWLVLPEMSFSGYNFRDAADIAPFLEPRGSGPSARWARDVAVSRRWYVTVGYPELSSSSSSGTSSAAVAFNSSITYGPDGREAAHYRKRFLYYTDERWAREGGAADGGGFFAGALGDLGRVAMGICMDLNPYRFTAPWRAYEFANHVLAADAPVAAVCMAWITHLTAADLAAEPDKPDHGTFGYWIERLFPLRQDGAPPTVVVCANRCGTEDWVCYAGSSAVLSFKDGQIGLCGILGRAEEGCLVVDTEKPKWEITSNHKDLI